MNRATKILSLVLILSFALTCTTAFAEEERAAEYLSEYYNIPAFEETVTLEAFNDALSALGQEPIAAETLSVAEAVVAAVKLADMEAFALTYINDDAPDKAANVLAEEGVEVDEAYAPYVACALELDLIDAEDLAADALSGETAAELLYGAAEIAGMGRHYIGRVSDDDILTTLKSTLDSFIIFDEEQLTNLGTEIVLRGATTGYNLKYSGYDARFLEEYTLKYGHSDITHALQLIALLDSEGYDAYIQIEPKVSVYEYMIEWGEPGDPTPTYAVKQVTEDRYLCYAVEYDMLIEFETIEEKESFHDLIETYAKKYDDSFDADGNLVEKLLSGSWWQPLYSSTTEMENEEFGLLYDNVIYDATGSYSIHPFSLPDATQAIADVVAEVAPELSVSLVEIHVNPAFYRYITGTDHQ